MLLSFSMVVAFLEFKTPKPALLPSSLIVCLLAVETDCAIFKDAVQASDGGPDRTCLRAGCGPQDASMQPSYSAKLPFSFLA